MAQLVKTEVVDRATGEVAFNTAGEAIAKGKTVQAIQTQYATAVAVQKPRDLIEVERLCLQEAALAGEVCFYGWGAGKDRIEGPSIDCAMIAARNWGNAAVEMRPVADTPTAYILEAGFIDLERGFTLTRQFRQSKKWKVHGKFDDERKDDIRFQIGQSKAQRNCILKALPKWLFDKMLEVAKKGVREKIEKYIKSNSIEAARKLALDGLAKFSVSLERIEEKYGKKYKAWDVDMLIVLKGDIRALADGIESADMLFPIQTEEEPEPEKGKIDPEKMKNGDPDKHQGHEPEPAGQVKGQPDKPLLGALIDAIMQLEEIADYGDRKIPDLRMEFVGYMDIRKEEVGYDKLKGYHEFLQQCGPKNGADPKPGF